MHAGLEILEDTGIPPWLFTGCGRSMGKLRGAVGLPSSRAFRREGNSQQGMVNLGLRQEAIWLILLRFEQQDPGKEKMSVLPGFKNPESWKLLVSQVFGSD